MLIFLYVMVFVLSVPGSYLQYYSYIELPKKIGYFKFILLMIGYVLFFAFMIYLLTEGYIGLATLIISMYLVELPIIWLLRKEIMRDYKRWRGFSEGREN